VTEFYDIGKVLGAGQFGTTRLAVHKESGKHYACKSILKSRLNTMPNMDAAVRKVGRLSVFYPIIQSQVCLAAVLTEEQ
jgi:serine/threonine protein kinase